MQLTPGSVSQPTEVLTALYKTVGHFFPCAPRMGA
jgi:hypothetical protein